MGKTRYVHMGNKIIKEGQEAVTVEIRKVVTNQEERGCEWHGICEQTKEAASILFLDLPGGNKNIHPFTISLSYVCFVWISVCVFYFTRKIEKENKAVALKRYRLTHTHYTHNEEITVFCIINKCKNLTDLCYKELYVINS